MERQTRSKVAGAVTEGESTADTLEWKKFDAETKLKEAESRRQDEELQLRREEIENKKAEMLKLDKFKEEELELRREEMRRQDESSHRQDENKKEKLRLKAIELQLACDTKQQNDRCNNKKQFMEQVNTAASTIKHLLEPCPSNLREVPAYFRKNEQIFDSHNVEWDYRADILTMNLDNKMKSWITNLSGEDMKN